MTHLVKCKWPLVLQDPSCAVQHAAVRPFRGRLHALNDRAASERRTRVYEKVVVSYHFDDVKRLADQHLHMSAHDDG